jgi:hypothetical protein
MFCAPATNTLVDKLEPELFIRSVTAGWLRMALNEVQTNSVASTADEYYKGVFAARELAEAEGAEKKRISTTGMAGFQEQAQPNDWDFAMGLVQGFRKWSVNASQNAVVGSYSKDFLAHKMLEDGRRVGICYQSGSSHPPEQVPADSGCGCGWWAYWSPEEAKKHGGASGDNKTVFAVTVAVEGSGRVVIGQKGFRSQYVRVTGIAPDTEIDPAGLEALAAFSRKHLLDAPVYRGTDALREGVGCDPVYGTLTARYSEIAMHSDQALAIYVDFLKGVRSYIAFFVDVDPPNKSLADRPFAMARSQDASQAAYLQISAELLASECKIASQIIRERSDKSVAEVLQDVHRP